MSMQTMSTTAIDAPGPRTRGKRDASRDFEGLSRPDVDALIQNARESYDAARGDAKKYWLSYWGRLIELRRQDYQRRHPAIGHGRYTTA